ncbi:MAG: S-methyl-5-thioribose-1-phosphate isomerase [Planctomycetota bacterium]|nr:S-methyl-5-thioribose-1-phosphate isomerase [Planctomycetota bacterium]
MNVDGKHYRTIWLGSDGSSVEVIDQTKLPHEFVILKLTTLEDAIRAIKTMVVRGAPLIGATAAYGFCLGMCEDASDEGIERTYSALLATRPTAVNLQWALQKMRDELSGIESSQRVEKAYALASAIADEDVAINESIGKHGLGLLKDLNERRRQPECLNILTHCNAGWLATVDWGTALSPIYAAHNEGIPVHVWVDETRPRNQGASLTAWELGQHGVAHTVIADNVGGHLMQHDMVDCVITGTDRTTCAGDVCNKIGTYLKALAARDNDVPFYVGLPGPTIDWTIQDGVRDIPIEQRDAMEVSHITGRAADGSIQSVQLIPEGSPVRNDAFDVTPRRLVTGLITERGVCEASPEGLATLYPELGNAPAPTL